MIYDAQKSRGPLQGWLSSHSLSLLVAIEMWAELGRENERMGQWAMKQAARSMDGCWLLSALKVSHIRQAIH